MDYLLLLPLLFTRVGIFATFLQDRKSTRLNSSHLGISYAVFCLKKKSRHRHRATATATPDRFRGRAGLPAWRPGPRPGARPPLRLGPASRPRDAVRSAGHPHDRP